MVITVQGYNNKNNKAIQTAASLAGMSAITTGNKTLVLQLIEDDIDNVEDELYKIEKISFGGEKEAFEDKGIDSIIRVIESSKINKDDFSQICTPLLRAENRLDICAPSKNTRFYEKILTNMELITDTLDNAKEVYQDIYIVCPAKHPDVIEAINNLNVVDVSIYCMKQGHRTRGKIYGKKPFFIATEFDENSVFTLKSMKETYGVKSNFYKIERNTNVTDAAMKGRLLYLIKKNTENDKLDINYVWAEDVKTILEKLSNANNTGKKHKEPKEIAGYIKKLLGYEDMQYSDEKNLEQYDDTSDTSDGE